MLKKADFMLLATLLVLCLIWGVVLLSGHKAGHTALVKSGNEIIARLPLDTDTTLCLEHNTVTVCHGTVWMESADCPDQICVSHAPVSKVGETVVCLPNRIILEVTS